jgi:hypothetical protein
MLVVVVCSCSAAFFSISASTLTSKWIGEGEKMVRVTLSLDAIGRCNLVLSALSAQTVDALQHCW